MLRKAFIRLHGDPSVGIHAGVVTISDIDTDFDDWAVTPLHAKEMREEFRDKLREAFNCIASDGCDVVFDDELPQEA